MIPHLYYVFTFVLKPLSLFLNHGVFLERFTRILRQALGARDT